MFSGMFELLIIIGINTHFVNLITEDYHFLYIKAGFKIDGSPVYQLHLAYGPVQGGNSVESF